MKLLVDMGNSTMKWTTVSDGVLSQVSASSYDGLLQKLKSEWQSLNNPEIVIVSCVAHQQQWQELSQLVEVLWGMTPERVVSPVKGSGVINAYQQPGGLGSDRWAALVAAHALYKQDICIVDCGTALTIDLLSAAGQHLGGVIVPGAEMMQNSLHLDTAALPKTTVSRTNTSEQQYWGRDTQSGIMAGTWQALAGCVKQVYGQFTKQSNESVCVLCGGGANQLVDYLDIKVELKPELVLTGLAIIAGENITL